MQCTNKQTAFHAPNRKHKTQTTNYKTTYWMTDSVRGANSTDAIESSSSTGTACQKRFYRFHRLSTLFCIIVVNFSSFSFISFFTFPPEPAFLHIQLSFWFYFLIWRPINHTWSKVVNKYARVLFLCLYEKWNDNENNKFCFVRIDDILFCMCGILFIK